MGRHDLHPIVQRERTLGRLMSVILPVAAAR
jgi:hypothetical protein